MQIATTDTLYLYVPVHGPKGTDLTQYPVDVALAGEQAGEPLAANWKAAAWAVSPDSGDYEARLLVTAGDYPAGSYMAWVRVHATPELRVLKSGRVRVGDL